MHIQQKNTLTYNSINRQQVSLIRTRISFIEKYIKYEEEQKKHHKHTQQMKIL